jgi:NADPH:quinone reductase-like Zn-dependent oxidoreductase
VGNRSVWDYQRALSPQGMCVITGFTSMPRLMEHMLLGPRISKAGGKTIRFQGIATTPKKDLVFIKELLEEGKVVPVIDQCYPLSKTAAAIRYLEHGHARGKVVITVDHNSST